MTQGGIWWTILVDHVRVGVKASTSEDAFRIFIDKKMSKSEDARVYGRKVPPKRAECNIRQALPVEVESYERRRTRLPLTQDTALFDGAQYDKKERARA